MELTGPPPVRQRIADPDHIGPDIARDRLFWPENHQEVLDSEIPRLTETWHPDNVDRHHTLH
jgi:hypothetical protein